VTDAPALTAAQQALVRVSAALATRDAEQVRGALEAAVHASDHRAVDEAILQAHLFVGFPDALNALLLWREVSGSRAPAAPEPRGEWERRGEEVCARVYGANYDKLRRNVAGLHPDLDRWMVEGGYGRVIGREGLDLVTRELCIAALLAVWRVPRQLFSHLRGALNAGAAPEQVDRAVAIAVDHLDPPGAASVLALWREVRSKARAVR
jgi:4-carboxymuconolactone decarboxylase